MLDMKCISGAKIPPFGEAPVYYNSVSQDANTDIQIVSSINTQKLMKIILRYQTWVNETQQITTNLTPKMTYRKTNGWFSL